jgi:hypothetical protein
MDSKRLSMMLCLAWVVSAAPAFAGRGAKGAGPSEPADSTPAALREVTRAASEACGRPITARVDTASFAGGSADGIDPTDWCRQLVESVAGGCTMLKSDASTWQAWKAHPLSSVTCQRDSRYPAYATIAADRGASVAEDEVFGNLAAPEVRLDGANFTFGYFAGSVNLTNYTHDAMVAGLASARATIQQDAAFQEAVGELRTACQAPALKVVIDLDALRPTFRPAVTEAAMFNDRQVEVVQAFDEAGVQHRLIPLFRTMSRLCTERPQIEERVVMPAGGTGRVTRPTRPFPVDRLTGLTEIRVVPDGASDAFRAAGKPTGSENRRFQEAQLAGRYDALLMGEELDREGEHTDTVFPTFRASGSVLSVGLSDLTYGREGYGRGDLLVVRLLDLAFTQE